MGATVKRTADNLVLHGTDITNAGELVEAVSPKTRVQMFLIKSSEIEQMVKEVSSLKNVVPTVPGTMRLHQVTTTGASQIEYRDVSCVCRPSCECFQPRKFTFPVVLGATHDALPTVVPVSTNDAIAPNDWYYISESNDVNLQGKHVIVMYNQQLYPGIVTRVDHDHDDDMKVKCMKRAG